ncbi:hypothetical protein BJ508DRAFT_372936 [Ascobolus immersus RN42]|uniref:Uncharacterized protein n=1 Tax=Ascobolus immersus RN42 TaxID=1160509 RepID=A0A3N4IJ40_ASCIM|nr:hypothetical protein BJ508DRAFT_372936 [Ascobolus immersus RN42]
MELKQFHFTSWSDEMSEDETILATNLVRNQTIFCEESSVDDGKEKNKTPDVQRKFVYDGAAGSEDKSKLVLKIPSNKVAQRDFPSSSATYLVLIRQTLRGVRRYKLGTCVHIGAGDFLTVSHIFVSAFRDKPDQVEIRLYKCEPFSNSERIQSITHLLKPFLTQAHLKKAFSGKILDTFEVSVVAHMDAHLNENGWAEDGYQFRSRHLDFCMLRVKNDADIPRHPDDAVRPGTYEDNEDTVLTGINQPISEDDADLVYSSMPTHVSRKSFNGALAALLPLQKSTATGRSAKCTQLDPAGTQVSSAGCSNAAERLIVSEIPASGGMSGGGLYSRMGYLIGIHLAGVQIRDVYGALCLAYPNQFTLSINLSFFEIKNFIRRHHLPRVSQVGSARGRFWIEFLLTPGLPYHHGPSPRDSTHSLRNHSTDSVAVFANPHRQTIKVTLHAAQTGIRAKAMSREE